MAQLIAGRRVVALNDRYVPVRHGHHRDPGALALKRARDIAIYDAKFIGWPISALARITGLKRDYIYGACERAHVLTEHEKRMARLEVERTLPS